MKRRSSPILVFTKVAGMVLLCILLCIAASWIYTKAVLNHAKVEGVYATAEEGMLALLEKSYVEPEVRIIGAGPNDPYGSNPHVWYVVACVWAEKRIDGSPVGNSRRDDYDQPGSFFLDTKDGWVYVGEGAFPGIVGTWMKAFGWAGPGSSQPSQEMGSGRCFH